MSKFVEHVRLVYCASQVSPYLGSEQRNTNEPNRYSKSTYAHMLDCFTFFTLLDTVLHRPYTNDTCIYNPIYLITIINDRVCTFI